MFAVVFEVQPADGRKDEYLAHARELKPIIETIDGFIDNERFESELRPGWVLSLSTWRDEKALIRWRVQSDHHGIQALGRSGIFADYHLRVCEITADTHPPAGVPVREQRFDPTEVGSARALAITELSCSPGSAPRTDARISAGEFGLDRGRWGLVDHDVYESIYNPGKLLLLTAWRDADQAGNWSPADRDGQLRHRTMRTIRDYGMFDRREAPQYYPPVPSRAPLQR
jgi:heme-degrading monooxygenase HmoA